MKRVFRYVVCAALLSAGPLSAEGFTEDEITQIAQGAGIDPAVLMVEGDIEYGAYLSGECTTCHQVSGAHDGIPNIVQWDTVFFMLAMHEYKLKSREHPVMQMVAGRLGTEEIAALAAYFAQLEIE